MLAPQPKSPRTSQRPTLKQNGKSTNPIWSAGPLLLPEYVRDYGVRSLPAFPLNLLRHAKTMRTPLPTKIAEQSCCFSRFPHLRSNGLGSSTRISSFPPTDSAH